MRWRKVFAAAVAVAGGAVLAFGQGSLAGEWTGAVTIEIAHPEKVKDPESVKLRDSLQEMVGKVKVALTMRADGTFSLTATQPGKAAPDKVEGKWTLKGEKLEMLTVTQNGVAPKQEDKKVFTVAKDHKSFSALFDDGGDEMRARLTFTPKKPG